MAKNAKKCKAVVEKSLKEMFGVSEFSWSNASHPVCTFYLAGKKFTYSVDSSPKAEYTVSKTKKMVRTSLMHKALQWGYISDLAEFDGIFLLK